MKKKLVFSLIFCMMLSILPFNILAEEFKETEGYDALVENDLNDFVYDTNGVITDYYGTSDYVRIPGKIDGTPIVALGDYAFTNKNVKSVLIEEGIQTVGIGCFEGTNIEDVDFPESLTYISEKAFKDCKNLGSVWINSYNFEIADGAFSDTEFIEFCIHCKLTDQADEIVKNAKGDNNYRLQIYHPALVESMVEKDMWGENLVYCELCGFKGSKYLSNRSTPFEDVANDTWYYPYVLTAYEFGILNGKTENTFDPNVGMTLAEAAKIAACIYNYTLDTNAEFTVKPGENWYQPYVDFCYEHSIIEDYIVFKWEEPATRAQMAYLFSRADSNENVYYINPDVPLTDIPDVYDTTPFAYEILELYRKGIAVGGEYMAFYPDSGVKRSEAAAFISRILCYDMRVDLPKG